MMNRKRKPTFVLVVPRFEDLSHAYFAGEIIKGVSLSASRLNSDVLLHIVDRKDHRGWLDSSLMDKAYVDGIIFADIDNDVDVVKKAIRYGMPCIVLNNIIDEPINYVAIDNRKAAVDIVDYLVDDLGHREIATIAGDTTTQAGLMRLEGFQEAMQKRGLELPRNYICFGDFLRTPARQAAEKLLKLKNRPTAVFAASDVMALELMDVARSLKIKIPEELAVVGFDDNPLVTSSIQLTTVFQPLIEMGRLGAENLSLISRGEVRLPVKTTLPTKLIKRKSTAKLK